MDWHQRIRDQFHGRPLPEDDVIDELAHHAAAAYQSARAEGCAPEEAERRLQELLSAWSRDASLLRRRPRRELPPAPPAVSSSGALGLAHDVRYSYRVMRRDRAHSLLVVATMALGIAAATSLFSVTYGVLLKPLPWPDPDRLVRVMESRKGGAPRVAGTVSNGTYLSWRQNPSTIEEIGGWMNRSATLTGAGDPERLPLAAATPSLFTVLRARPAHGRLFNSGDAVRRDVLILSHGLWQERFGGRPDAIGRTVRLDGQPYTVVGIMAADFPFPVRTARAWIPLQVPEVAGEGGMRRMSIFASMARLKPGASPAQAAAEGTSRGRSAPDPGMAAMALFGSSGPVEISVVPALAAMTAEVRPALAVLLVAVGLLLATATANVASLQLARLTTRRRELAVRAAIGAGAARLARQLIVESALLGIAGGAAGLALASLLMRALPSVLPADFPRAEAIAIDAPVMLFALVVSLVTSVAFGLLPALQARRVNLVASLAEDNLAPIGGALRSPVVRARAAIMVGQVAVACVLLVGAALLGRTLIALANADRGFDAGNLLTARVPLSVDYPPERRTQVLEAVTERMKGLPGVTHATFANALPLMSLGGYTAFTMRSPRDGAEVQVEAAQRVVSPDYFGALRLRILAGRGLDRTDSATSRPVLVVNRSFARRYLGDRPIGARIPWRGSRAGSVPGTEGTGWEVVGVVEDVRQGSVDGPAQPEIFAPYAQLGADTTRAFDPVLAVRTSGDPAAFVTPLRQILREQDPSLALDSVMTMDDRVSTSLERPRTYALLVGGFAAFAVLIAAVGLFGVLAYSVAQRAREIGVRAALGATPGAIVVLIARQAFLVTAAGLVVGLIAAAVSMQALSSFLYGVRPRDASTFAAVAALLLVVAAAAAVVPARRAASVDPLKVLR